MPFIINRDYDGFANWQLAARENAALPPFRKFAVIRAESTTRGAAKQLLMRLADELNQGQVKGQFKGQGHAPNQSAMSTDKANSCPA